MSSIVSVQSIGAVNDPANLTANLAVVMARNGHRVGVIDTGRHPRGLHALFGLEADRADQTWNDVIWSAGSPSGVLSDVGSGVPSGSRSTTGSDGHAAVEGASEPIPYRPIVREGSGEILVLGRNVYLVPGSTTAGDFVEAVREGRDVDAVKDGLQTVVSRLSLEYLVIDSHPDTSHQVVLPLALSDSLLVVLRPTQDDYQRTAVTVDLARRLNVPRILIAVEALPHGFDATEVHEQVEHIFNTVVAGILPAVEDLDSSSGQGVFCLAYPNHPWTRELEKIANQITG